MFTFKKYCGPVCKYIPMTVKHYQRSIPTYFKTKEVEDAMLNDEYNIKICSALISNFENFIDWMFFKSYSMTDYAKNRKVPVRNNTKDQLIAISHEAKRATMIFVSNTDSAQLIKHCNNANASKRWPELFFVPLFDKNDVNNACAESLISYYINANPTKHVVIFAKQIGSRSLSVPEIDNVCIMINDPSFSSAVQKMHRNQTVDINHPNKTPKVYWYTLQNLTVNLCPLFEIIKSMDDYASNNHFTKTFIDTADIFIEVDGEFMQMNSMPNDPYKEYLDSTANTFYRKTENFEYLTTFSQREELYKMFASLELDLTKVKSSNFTNKCSNQANADAEDIAKSKNVFEGRIAIKNGKKNNKNKTKEILDVIMHIKNIIIALAMRYEEHEHPIFNNFTMDFSQLSKNKLTSQLTKSLQSIYDKMKECKIIS